MYEVVYPLGNVPQQSSDAAPRLESLHGKTIAELCNHKFGAELTFSVLREELRKRFPDIRIVPHQEFGDTYGPAESEVIADLPAKLKALEVDAVISGNGG